MRGHLRVLEAEAIHLFREVAAQFERPVILFSGGKDSAVLAWLARKALHPAPAPFPLLHTDTGHDFPEMIEFRERFAADMEFELTVRSVQDTIDGGRVREEAGPEASRNALQTVTLLHAIREFRVDAALGGADRAQGVRPLVHGNVGCGQEHGRPGRRARRPDDALGRRPSSPRTVGRPRVLRPRPDREHPSGGRGCQTVLRAGLGGPLYLRVALPGRPRPGPCPLPGGPLLRGPRPCAPRGAPGAGPEGPVQARGAGRIRTPGEPFRLRGARASGARARHFGAEPGQAVEQVLDAVGTLVT